jgi:hypothetical protein
LHRHRSGAAALALAVALAAGAAAAHIVYGTSTLRLLVLESDLVVQARIRDPESELVIADPLLREYVVVAEPLGALKGEPPAGPLRFVQHGHGSPRYAEGEEAVLFLRRIERSRELGASPLAARVPWVSVQESDAGFPLDAASREPLLAALRAYAGLERLPPAQQPAALRRVTLELLASPSASIASSALRDVVLAGELPLVTAEDLPALEPLLSSPATPVGVRVGLLAELERRGLLEGPPRWARLVRETRGQDRFAVVRAAAAHPSEPVTGALVDLLASDDPLLVSAAAVSLGAPGNEAAVAPLAQLLASDEQRVRLAAIRGLGRIATSGARAQLAATAQSHPDPATRRRAAAELRTP